MTHKPASEVRKGDRLVFRVEKSLTVVLVLKVEETTEADLVPDGFFANPRPILAIHISLPRDRYIVPPDIPSARVRLWTLWHYPDDDVELWENPKAAT